MAMGMKSSLYLSYLALFLFFHACCSVASSTNVNTLIQKPTLIIVDGFTEYISGYAREYCRKHNIDVIDAVSPYLCEILLQQGRRVPDYLRAPKSGQELTWLEEKELLEIDKEKLCCLSESDSGVSTAERLQVAFGIRGNGQAPQLRNKYLMNSVAKEHGLPIVFQSLVRSIEDIEKFLLQYQELYPTREIEFVIKPCRGVASDGVYLCHSLNEGKRAFQKLYQQPRYGGGVNDAVVIQEYIDGPEYAVDTVVSDGESDSE
jgi:hypothetical protein